MLPAVCASRSYIISADCNRLSAVRAHEGRVLFSVAHGAELVTTVEHDPSVTAKPQNSLVSKYWKQRYRLFHKWDLGVRLDETAWYSVTPESIAVHHAVRCSSLSSTCENLSRIVILDAFCGIGGNAIQFALRADHVLAFDNRLSSLRLAAHNAEVYKVRDKIELICADAIQALPSICADVIFLSPPWGGPNYHRETFRLSQLTVSNMNGLQILKQALQITRNVAYYLPRNVDLREVLELGVPFEVERNFLNGKLKTVTLYFGELMA